MSIPPPPPGSQPPGDRPPFPSSQPFPGSPPYPAQPWQQGPGAPPPGYAGYGQQQAPQGNSGMAIAGFVLSLVGLIPCFWFWFLQIPGYLGVIFSFLGLKATKDGSKKGRGLAIAGVVVGLIVVAIALAVTAFVYTSDDCIRDGLSFECNFD